MTAGREFINQVSHNLLATRIQDPKRGKDTRARMLAISERSLWFTEKVERWHTLAKPLRADLEDGVAPSLRDELMLYQTLLACWPLTLVPDDKPGMETFLVQLLRWQEKVLRDTKLRNHLNAPESFYEPDFKSDYEIACAHFLIFLMTGDDTDELRRDIAAAAASLAPAGVINSLSQISIAAHSS